MATEEVAAAIRSTGLDVDVAEPAQVLGVEGQDEEVVDAGPLIHMDERHSSLSSSASPFLLGLKTPPPAPSRTSGPALTSPPMSLGSQDEVIEGWLQLTSPHHLKGIVIKPQAASEPPALHPALDLWSDHHTSSQLSAPLTSDGAVTTYSFSNHKDQGAQSGIRKSSMTFQASSSMGPLSRPRTLSSVSQGRRGSGSGSGAAVNVNRLLSLSEITPTSVEASVLAHEASSPMGTPNDKAAARKTIPHRESFTVWLDSNPSSPDSPAGDKSWKRKKEKEKPVSFKDLLSPSSSSQLSHPSSPMEDDVIDEEPVVDEIAELPQIKTMRLKRDEAKSGSSLDRPPSSSSSPHRPMEASLGHMAEGFMALSLHQADRRRERTNLSIQAPSNLNEARPVAHGPWMPLDSDGNVESDPNSPHLCKAVEGGSPVLRWNVDLFDAEGFATRSGSSGSLNRPPPRITYWNLVTESSDKDLGSPPSASKLSPYPRSDLRTPAPSAAINSHKLDSSHGSPFPSPSSSSSTIKKALTMSPLTKNQSQSVRTREGGSEEPGLRSPFYAEPSHPHPLTPLSPRRHHVDFAIDPLAPAETTDVVPDTPTSRMSGSSPFSGSTMDRPCPFRISANGSRVSVDPDLSSEIEFCASPASSSARKYSWGYGSLGARRLNQRAIEASRRSDPTVSSVARGESCELKCGLTNGSKERTSASFIGDMASSSSGLLPSEAGSERRRSSALEAIPDTPTSRMSGSSVFAVGAVFDRPCPFVVTSTGAHADVSTLPVARETTLPERPSGSWGSSPASPDQALTPTPLLPNTCYSPTPKWSMKDKDQDEQDER